VKRRGKKDGNHDELVRVFRDLGCTVAELHDTGLAGWPDIVVGVAGVDRLVELKNPETRYGRAGLNANQSAFARDWRGGRVWVASSSDEAVALVQNWRRP
jgi:hypothetical protein